MGRPLPEIAAEAVDQRHLRTLLDSVAEKRFGSPCEVTVVSAEPCGRRAFLYSARLSKAGSPEKVPWRVIGKVYETPEAGQRSFEVMRALWEQGFAPGAPAAVRIPEPYGYVPDLRLLLMEEALGAPLKKLVKKSLARPDHMRLLARALLTLHRSGPIFTQPFTIEHHLAIRCGSLHEALAEAYPDLADAIQRIVQAARESETRVGYGAFTLAHGDFHLGQVHVEAERIWILDLDPLHVGDPAYDVAMVFVALKQCEQKTGASSYIHGLRDAFVSAYFSDADWDIAGRVPLHEALIHLKRACKRLRWQDEAGWQDLIPLQIRQSVACLEAWRGLTAPRSVADLTLLYERCPAAV